MSIQYVYVNSSNKTDRTTSNATFEVEMRNIIKGGSRVSLQYVSMPNTFYNVTSKNDTYSFDSTEGTVAHGRYTLTEILTALATATTYTFAYDPITNSISVTDGVAFTLEVGDNSILGDLGFQSSGFSLLTHYSTNEPKFINPQNVYLCINDINTSHLNRGFNFSYQVPVNTVRGDVLQLQYCDYPQIGRASDDIQRIEVVVRDEEGLIVEGLSDWNFCLRIE